MAITRVNGVVRNHKKAKSFSKKLRRKVNKRRNRDERTVSNPSSKHLANCLRNVWDFESRQSRRWLIAMQQAGSISAAATDILHTWINVKTPAEQGKLATLSDNHSGSIAERNAHKEALVAWKMLEKERQEAMGRGGDGVTVGDWWYQGVEEHREIEDTEHAEEGDFDDEDDAMSVVSDEDGGDDDDEEGGAQLEPPEPVSPIEYAD